MLGVNQVIFMDLFMVAITALIGTQDLGAEINSARSGNEIGKALVAGLCIAFMGMAADRLIGAWVRRKKVQLGRSEEHTSELQSLMRISYAVFCLKKKTTQTK